MSTLSHFATHSGMKISGPSLQECFTRSAAAFLEALLSIALTQVVVADPVAIPLLRRFGEVIVEDRSTFTLPDQCRELWQGCGGSTSRGTQSALQDGRTPDNRSSLKGE